MSSLSKTLVLCFDGTDDEFGTKNSNVVKLFSLLCKTNEQRQLCYYQAGIGTYVAPGIMFPVARWFAKVADLAVAWYLDHHVMEGYQFLMQNYQDGDRICLFGFSRGAYTARALAAMLYRVGLLPRDNIEQVPFAYKIYASTGKTSDKEAASFKDAFSRTVTINFIGCWDTVSSTGIIYSKTLPFTDSNTMVRTFRHALSLDEHRVRFRPNLWHRAPPSQAAAKANQRVVKGQSTSSLSKEPKPLNTPPSDTLEVWFAGCHTDIGGGNQNDAVVTTLSDITLRWMVREVLRSQCEVIFDEAALANAGIPTDYLLQPDNLISSKDDQNAGDDERLSLRADPETAARDQKDAPTVITDELKKTPLWWLLEILPMPCAWQDEAGRWHQKWSVNLGRGRQIYQPNPNFYITVQERISDAKLSYQPRAKYSGQPNWIS